MDTVENLDAQVITIDDKFRMDPQLKSMFPRIRTFGGVDLRKVEPLSLRQSNMISHSAFHTMKKGRKWHKEISSAGAIGIHQSNRLILQRAKGPVLILEDDCHVSPKLRHTMSQLLAAQDQFDVAIVGAVLHDIKGESTVPYMTDSGWKTGQTMEVILLHCVLYSSEGRKKVLGHLMDPQEVQLDALYSMLHNEGLIRVIVYDKDDLAWQAAHVSTIQEMTGTCALCMIDPTVSFHSLRFMQLVAGICILLILGLLLTRHRLVQVK